MLYIISGASRAGKTMIARKLSAQKGLSCFSLDWLVMGFTNGLPDYGIHDKLFPDEIAERAWSFLKAMFESMIWGEEDYIIEGEAILPGHIKELIQEHPAHIRVCFVGFTDIDIDQKVQAVKMHSTRKKDWLYDKPDAYIRDHVQNMVDHSVMIREACREHEIAYFDTSAHFLSDIETAVAYLME